MIDTDVQGVTLSCAPELGEILADGRFLASGENGGTLYAWVYIFHFRKVLLCIPVVAASIYLARLNWTQLPDQVGLSLMANGQFAQTVAKEAAVYGPMGVTAICLALMVCSRRALYPWLISVFSLVLPVVLWLSNMF